MSTNLSAVEHLRLRVCDGQILVPVGWNEAESLQTHLRKRKIGSTVYFDPVTRQARLEVWPGIAVEKVQAALECWPGSSL